MSVAYRIPDSARQCLRWSSRRKSWVPKRGFVSEQKAKAKIPDALRTQMHAYRCVYHGWHIGHLSKAHPKGER